MENTLKLIVGLAAVAFFIWLMIPTSKSRAGQTDAAGQPFIDADDSYQLGMLAGLTGASIPDAAVMRFALQRFQEIHGRRATTADIGIVLGMVNSRE